MNDVAVIIVNWNGKKHLETCLLSLSAQTYKKFKTIVVDNGSTDGSLEFLRKSHPQIEIISLKNNTGFAHPNNLGIKKAFADQEIGYIITLNNDIKAEPDFVEKLVECARRHPEAGAIQPKVLNFFDHEKIDCAGIIISRDGTAHNRGYGQKDLGRYDKEEEVFGANGTASLFTRRALEETVLPGDNFFDADYFAYYEDVDLAWRLKRAGFRTFFCPKAKVFHVHSATGNKVNLLKAYYLHRNHFFTVIKNYPRGKMLGTFLARAVSYAALAGNVFRNKKREMEMMQGNGKAQVGLAILRAWGSVAWNLPGLLKKRKSIMKKLQGSNFLKISFDWKMFVFLGIVAVGILLRTYNFSNWLFFKMDQARDATLIKQAFIHGAGWLPLLGPKAGGTDLNVGPAFYYFQYAAAVIFHSVHPAILAFPDLIFGILSIPLFYVFLKKYFSRNWSLILASLYAVNFLGVEYSRFAWNPNSLTFFNLLYFLGLLNIFDGNSKHKERWLVVAGVAFAISTQLHFLSFATLPLVTAIFIALNRRDVKTAINWKKVAIFSVAVVIVYVPVIMNEILSHGENTAQFFSALKNKPSHHSLWQNIKRDIRYWGQNWFLILSSWISRKASIKPALVAWLGLMLPGLFLAIKFWRDEKEGLKKKFLLISIVWFLVYFLVYIPVAYQIRPRFFLPMLALPFVFVGYLGEYFFVKGKLFLKAGVTLALGVIFAANLAGTYYWFKEMNSAQKRGVYPKRTIILKARDGITLWHLENAAKYVGKDCQYRTAYYISNPEYKYPFRYLLGEEGVAGASPKNFSPEQNGCFYALGLSRSKKGIDAATARDFDSISQEKFGALTIYKLVPRESFLENLRPKKEKTEEDRLFWGDVF